MENNSFKLKNKILAQCDYVNNYFLTSPDNDPSFNSDQINIIKSYLTPKNINENSFIIYMIRDSYLGMDVYENLFEEDDNIINKIKKLFIAKENENEIINIDTLIKLPDDTKSFLEIVPITFTYK